MAIDLLKSLGIPELKVAPRLVTGKLEKQISRGEQLADVKGSSSDELFARLKDIDVWSAFTYTLLQQYFKEAAVATAYDQIAKFRKSEAGTWAQENDRLSKEVRDVNRFIRALCDRVDLLAEDSTVAPSSDGTSLVDERIPSTTNKVFIVHGHDTAAKETVARFIGQLGLVPVILHEQPNEGKTIIEKFEKHADVFFAIVILSPDDVGYPSGKEKDVLPRARQNVIFELGYFVGRLGRSRVCALNKGSVEIPSDYHGVAYVPFSDDGGWKFTLAKDLKSAGMAVDMNKAL